MKKLITIALIATMLLSCLAGCGLKQGNISVVNNAENVAVDMTKFDLELTNPSVYGGDYHDADTGKPSSMDTDAIAWYDTYKSAADNTFHITSANDFYFFQWCLSKNKSGGGTNNVYGQNKANKYPFVGKTIVLDCDIVLNEVADEGETAAAMNLKTKYQISEIAGNGYNYFEGTFDGQGHIVSGVYLRAASNNRSIFGPVYNATIKNVVFLNSGIDGTDGKSVAGIAMRAMGTNTFTNIYADVDVIKSVNNASAPGSGCFIGCMDEGTAIFNNCVAAGDVSRTAASAGGFIGNAKAATSISFTDCAFTGSVTTTSGGNVAGFVGLMSAGTISFTGCSSTGNLVSAGAGSGSFLGQCGATAGAVTSLTANNCTVSGNVSGTTATGGLFGYLIDIATISLENCSYSGTVTGDRCTGGIVGFVDCDPGDMGKNNTLTVTNCDVLAGGKVTIDFTNAKNTGSGGIIGRVRGAHLAMSGCDFLGDLKVSYSVAHDEPVAAGALIGVLFDGTYASSPTATIENCTVGGTYLFLNNLPAESAGTYIAAKVVGTVAHNANATMPNVTYTNVECTSTAAEKAGTDAGTVMTPVEYGHAAQIMGYQVTEAVGGKYDLRVVSTMGLNGRNVDDVQIGFKVTVNYWDATAAEGAGAAAALVTDQITYASTAYESIEGGNQTYAADSYAGADYLYAFVLKNIPEGTSIDAGTLQIVITPILADAEGTILDTAETITIGAAVKAPAA